MSECSPIKCCVVPSSSVNITDALILSKTKLMSYLEKNDAYARDQMIVDVENTGFINITHVSITIV